MKKKCEECGKQFSPTNNRAKFCTPGTGCRVEKKSRAAGDKIEKEEEAAEEEAVESPAPAKRPTIVPPAPRSPFHTWLALHDVLDERKRIAAASIRGAEEEIAKFEVEHPGIREDAAAKLRGLMGSTPVVLPSVKAAEA